jgi:class 3 adenylate cyclase
MSPGRVDHLNKRLQEAARVQRELERRMFHLKTLYDVSREISGATNTQSIMNNLLLMVMGTFGAERGAIVLVDIREHRITTVAHRGLDDGAETLLAPGSDAGVLPKFQDADNATILRCGHENPSRLTSLAFHIWTPFRIGDDLRGGLVLGDKLTEEPYTTDDCELLLTLANQAAVAIANARAHEQLLRYAQELESTVRRIQILESIRGNLAKFVPKTVQALIDESPEAPSFDKRDADVSVLFADITGYTRLSAEMDLDRVNQLIELYFGAFLDEIIGYGGDVNETAGDGLMVIFRDPNPRQHAAAAALAGLAIQRKAREINGTLEGFFEPIAMHVGVNSGIASVGVTKIEGVAGTRWTYTASGPTTNIAARLAALGDGDGVVLSEETRRRLGDRLAVNDMGLQTLKNVAHPIHTYRLLVDRVDPATLREFGAGAERRRHARRPVAWPVRVWLGERCFEVRAVDASMYGLRLADIPGDALHVGAACRLEITTDTGIFACTAEIRNLGPDSAGVETKDPCPLS